MSNVQLIDDLTPEDSYALYKAHGSMTKVLKSFGIGNDPRCRKILSANIAKYTGNNNHSQKHSKKFDHTIDFIRDKVSESGNITELLRAVGIQPTGGNYSTIKKVLQKYGIKIPKRHPSKWDDAKIYCSPSSYPRTYLSKRVRKDCWMDYKCRDCDLEDVWNGKKIKLQLDHINGQSTDNRKCNLRWLCPNCHSQTPTFAGKLSGEKKTKYAAMRNSLEYLSHTGDGDGKELGEFLKTGTLSDSIRLGSNAELPETQN